MVVLAENIRVLWAIWEKKGLFFSTVLIAFILEWLLPNILPNHSLCDTSTKSDINAGRLCHKSPLIQYGCHFPSG